MSRKSGFSNALSFERPRIHSQIPNEGNTFCGLQPRLFGAIAGIVKWPDSNFRLATLHVA
ncbi:MAG: hypothetical protein AUI54_01295 [Acidobacteria bacterium 13_1_40CM_2_56_5]|nr:MAG: hypothetical protein AUI54_01295 [Acidobacteria bacterium 13_1_40CM_2_56_5]